MNQHYNKMNKMLSALFKIFITICWLALIETAALSIKHEHSHKALHMQGAIVFKNNLSAKNWYYGTLTVTDYRARTFQAEKTSNSVMKECPVDTPFSTSNYNGCENCNADAPLRNLESSKCEPCPANQVYSQKEGNCTKVEVPVIGSNSTSGISSETPIQPQVVNPETQSKANQTTVNQTVANQTAVSNQPAMPIVHPNSKNSTSTTNSSSQNATDSKDNTTANISNTSSNTSSVTGTNTTTNTANTTTNTTNTTTVSNGNTTSISNSTSPAKNNTSETNKTSINAFGCPLDTPLKDNLTNKCLACPKGKEYINTTNVCLDIVYISNLKASTRIVQPSPNFLANQNNAVREEHPTRILQECPTQTPVLANNKTCVGCSIKQLFVISTQLCIKSCPKGTIYNSTLLQCVVGANLVNPGAPGLVLLNINYEQWKKQLQAEQVNTTNSQYCPEDKPYEIDGECVACEPSTPLYDVLNKACIKCQQGRYYQKEEKACKSAYNTDVSITRIIANII